MLNDFFQCVHLSVVCNAAIASAVLTDCSDAHKQLGLLTQIVGVEQTTQC